MQILTAWQIRAAKTASHTGSVLTVSGQNTETKGLVQSQITGKGAVTGGDQHLLPIAGVVAAACLQVLTVLLQASRALEQAIGNGLNAGAATEPVLLASTEITELSKALEIGKIGAVSARALQREHSQSLIKGVQQALLTQVISADKTVTVALLGTEKDSDPGTGGKGGADAGHPLLFSQDPEAITTLEEDFNQVGASSTTGGQQQLEPLAPEGFKKTHRGFSGWRAGIGRWEWALSGTAWPSPGR